MIQKTLLLNSIQFHRFISQVFLASALSNNEYKSMKLDKNEEQRRNNQIYLEEQGILIILDSFLMTEVMETPLLIKNKDMASIFSCQETAICHPPWRTSPPDFHSPVEMPHQP